MTAVALEQLPAETTIEARVTRQERFEQLVNRYLKDLYRFAYWLSGDRTVADDLVQESLVRAWKGLDRIQNPDAVKGWLMTILRRENARRFERRQFSSSEMPADQLPGQGDYDTSTEAFVLRQALQKLPADYREPLLLQVIHGYSQKEIAEQLGISIGGAGARLFRARAKLRELL